MEVLREIIIFLLGFLNGLIFAIIIHCWAKSKGKYGMDVFMLKEWWKL